MDSAWYDKYERAQRRFLDLSTRCANLSCSTCCINNYFTFTNKQLTSIICENTSFPLWIIFIIVQCINGYRIDLQRYFISKAIDRYLTGSKEQRLHMFVLTEIMSFVIPKQWIYDKDIIRYTYLNI